MGLFRKRKLRRPATPTKQMTPAEIEAHRAKVRAHVARVDAARAAKQADTVGVEASSTHRVREPDPVVVEFEPVHQGAAVQLIEERAIQLSLQQLGLRDAARVEKVPFELRKHAERGVSVHLADRQIGVIGAARVPEFLEVINNAENRPVHVVGHLTLTTERRAYIEAHHADKAKADANREARRERAEIALQPSETWVVSIDGDDCDMSTPEFDPEAFRRRVAQAAARGANIRMQWDDDWIETYTVTPELIIEMYQEFDDDRPVHVERLNG